MQKKRIWSRETEHHNKMTQSNRPCPAPSPKARESAGNWQKARDKIGGNVAASRARESQETQNRSPESDAIQRELPTLNTGVVTLSSSKADEPWEKPLAGPKCAAQIRSNVAVGGASGRWAEAGGRATKRPAMEARVSKKPRTFTPSPHPSCALAYSISSLSGPSSRWSSVGWECGIRSHGPVFPECSHVQCMFPCSLYVPTFPTRSLCFPFFFLLLFYLGAACVS